MSKSGEKHARSESGSSKEQEGEESYDLTSASVPKNPRPELTVDEKTAADRKSTIERSSELYAALVSFDGCKRRPEDLIQMVHEMEVDGFVPTCTYATEHPSGTNWLHAWIRVGSTFNHGLPRGVAKKLFDLMVKGGVTVPELQHSLGMAHSLLSMHDPEFIEALIGHIPDDEKVRFAKNYIHMPDQLRDDFHVAAVMAYVNRVPTELLIQLPNRGPTEFRIRLPNGRTPERLGRGPNRPQRSVIELLYGHGYTSVIAGIFSRRDYEKVLLAPNHTGWSEARTVTSERFFTLAQSERRTPAHRVEARVDRLRKDNADCDALVTQTCLRYVADIVSRICDVLGGRAMQDPAGIVALYMFTPILRPEPADTPTAKPKLKD